LHFETKAVEYYPNTNITYNVYPSNGYVGSQDPEPYFNGKYAEDYDEFTWFFEYDLNGDEGEEIRQLQTALQILGFFPKFQQLTLFYGNITRNAVRQFQVRYGIAWPLVPWLTPGYGRTGPKTRAKLNILFQEA